MSQRVIVLFTCLMVVTETRAECEHPSVEGNRILIEEPTNFPSGYEAKFKCATGYKPVNPTSSSVITCNGTQWTVLQLECKKKSCGSLGEIPNGMYIYSDGLQFGSTATAECKVGYKLVGDNTRNCFSDGWSGRNPVCEVVKCTNPPHIKNGELEDLIKEEYEYGEAVTYTCEHDFTPFGSLTISCSEDGTFQPSPPECLHVTCSEPDIQNGNRVQGAPPPYRYKQFVEYQCNSGYKMEGGGYLTCEETGWNPPPPKCLQVTCSEPDIQNGNRVQGAPPPPYRYKQFVEYQCNSGYKMEGGGYLTCEETGWNPPPPKCLQVTCSEPDIQNGNRVQGAPPPPYRYKQFVEYQCNSGYKMEGGGYLTCEETGWNPPPPKCLQVTCSEPDIQNGNRVQGAPPPPYRYKQFVEYQCNSGYKMEGGGYLTCEETGWNPPPPKCLPIATTKPKLSPGTLETIPGGSGSPRPPTTGPPTTTPPSSGSGLKLAFGLGIPILLATVVLVFFIKKRASRNERTLKVSTRNEDAEY